MDAWVVGPAHAGQIKKNQWCQNICLAYYTVGTIYNAGMHTSICCIFLILVCPCRPFFLVSIMPWSCFFHCFQNPQLLCIFLSDCLPPLSTSKRHARGLKERNKEWALACSSNQSASLSLFIVNYWSS